MLIREGRLNFVKLLPGMGFYDGTKRLDQIVDGELFIHIEKLETESFLTIQRGKHRKVEQTPIEHLYCVYKFTPTGIPDDLNKINTARRKVGGRMLGEMVDSHKDDGYDQF